MKFITVKIISLVVVTCSAAVVAFTPAFQPVKSFATEKIESFTTKNNPPKKEKVDLKIDSQCHYYQFDPNNPRAYTNGDLRGFFDAGCTNNGLPFGNWTATDLTDEKFFNFEDLKPGDQGEDTVSLHVTGQNACGTWEIYKIKDTGNDCTEPETETKDKDCKNKTPGTSEKNGELMENLEFKLWLDQGRTPGFQGTTDIGEGDNLFNEKDYLIFDWQNMDRCPKKLPLWYALRQARKNDKNICNQADRDGDGQNTQNGICAGLAKDGHLVKGMTYYYGFAWRFPAEVGNEAQTDELGFNMRFNVVPDGRCTDCSNPCDSCHKKNCPDCDSRCEDCIPQQCNCSE